LSSIDIPATPTLPPLSYTMIGSDDALAEACAKWLLSPGLAIDTEFMRVSTFYPEVGLIQIADAGEISLIDPLGIKDWSPFRTVMIHPNVVKIMHSCSEDMLVFYTFLQVLPTPVFDTQIAGAFLNQGVSLSYQNLVKLRYGIDLPKGETRSDWLQRPLTIDQLNYAALDVAYLVDTWRAQTKELQALDRESWMEEECQRLLLNYTDEVTGNYVDYYLNFKSAWQLRARPLLALQKLSEWREQRARKRNRPRSWILKDNALFAIANNMVNNKVTLAGIEDVSENFVKHEGDAVLALIQQASLANEADCPPRMAAPLTNGQKSMLKKMQQVVDNKATALGIPPELLGRKRILMPLLYAVLALPAGATLQRSEIPEELLGWRRELILDDLLNVLTS
jgi:ribonuclease D